MKVNSFTITLFPFLLSLVSKGSATSLGIVLLSSNGNVTAHSTVLLVCVAGAGSSVPEVNWLFNGSLLHNTSNKHTIYNTPLNVSSGLSFVESILEICAVVIEDEGQYTCNTAAGGITRNTTITITVLEDVDECQNSTHDCDQLCINTIGSYECSCDNEGFVLSKDRHSCTDVDECQNSTHDCDQHCINTIGSYECSCDSGFHLKEDERTCVSPPPKPVDVQTFCSHIIWHNPPNISCEIVSGYDVQFFDQANNQSVIRHADASGTFYSLNSVDKSSFKLESTSVQVRLISKNKHIGFFSPLKSLGCPLSTSDVFLQMRGVNYTNNSVINIADIGEGENALLCMTNNKSCCGTPPNRAGQFYFPNDGMVPIEGAGQGFYRDRRSQQIRLNRRQGIFNPTGWYHCEIPNASGVYQKLFFNLSIGGF